MSTFAKWYRRNTKYNLAPGNGAVTKRLVDWLKLYRTKSEQKTNQEQTEKGETQTVPNVQNLIPFNTLPEDQRKELARKGGLASGAARRRKRESIERAKIERAADNELYSEAVGIIRQCAKLLKR